MKSKSKSLEKKYRNNCFTSRENFLRKNLKTNIRKMNVLYFIKFKLFVGIRNHYAGGMRCLWIRKLLPYQSRGLELNSQHLGQMVYNYL